MKKFFLLIVILITFSGCDLSSPRIDASNGENMQKSIAKIMKSLDQDQQTQFQDAIKIIMFSDVNNLMDLAAMGQNMEIAKGAFLAKVDGKSAKEIIQIAAEIKKKKESGIISNENLVNKVAEEGKKETKQKLLNEAVKVSLKSIKLLKGDFGQNNVQVTIAFENVSGKNIRGIKGVAVFDDIFGDTIKAVNLSSDSPILKGETYLYNGNIDINPYIDSDLKLADTPKEKIQFSFQTDTILYENKEDSSEAKKDNQTSK